jgi:hypothetical protein
MNGVTTRHYWKEGGLAAFSLSALVVSGCGGGDNESPMPAPEIKVLSSPAEFVTGGSALVELVPPANQVDFSPSDLTVEINGMPLSSDTFDRRSNGRIYGLVSNLKEGENILDVQTRGDSSSITLTNYTKTNGVLVAPFQPIICRTVELGLAPATSEDCDAPTKYFFFYKSTDPAKTELQPYDPANPPSDVAQTTTDQGVTVPFIVRDERGVIDRSVYDITVLFDPAKPWTATAPQKAWNGKVFWRLQGGALPGHVQTANSEATFSGTAALRALGKGFAVASSGLNVLGNHVNTTLSAEGMLTVKSHLVTSYGPIRYTFGDGSSGSSIQQYAIANNYPGLLDGLTPGTTNFAEIWGVAAQAADCKALFNYWDNASVGWTDAQKIAVLGLMDFNSCTNGLIVNHIPGIPYFYEDAWWDPTVGCTEKGVGAVQGPVPGMPPLPSPGLWSPTNPTGVRCTLQDYMQAILGKRPDGYANRPYDNVGVQYGLVALKAGQINLAQFIDLNSRVGGIDINNNMVNARSEADVAGLPAFYKSGQIIDGKHLAEVAIISTQNQGNQIWHDAFRPYEIRARLIAANGTAANQVIWRVDAAGSGSLDQFTLMDQWLSAIEADTSSDSLAVKVVKNKPALAQDACVIKGSTVTDVATCDAAFPKFADPRQAAGGPLNGMIWKCQLKPVDASDYSPVVPTASELAQIQAVFANGVCDYSRPGVGQQPTVVWSRWP